MVAGLKALVIGLAVLIVMAMGLLVYGLIQRSDNPDFSFFGDSEPVAQQSEAPVAPPLAAKAATGIAFGETMVTIPDGCRLEDLATEAGRVLLRIGPSAGACPRVIVVDLATGEVLGSIRVAP
ncbi:MAG: hypothetical protein ACPGOV_04980 [Magnetovibrionaceae bacterium]